MIWRTVISTTLKRLQIVTLVGTTILGAAIAATPEQAASVSLIEHAMSADIWAFGLILFGTVGTVCQLDMNRRNHERWIQTVAVCHIALCALLAGYSTAAMVGVLLRTWWAFGGPTMGAMLCFFHYSFARRAPRA